MELLLTHNMIWSGSFIDFSAKYAELTANHWQKKITTYTQNLTKPKIGDTWSITNYGCPKIVLNNMIFWNLIWSPEMRRQIRPFLVLFKIRTCYLKKIWFGKCAVRFKCTVPFGILSKDTIKLDNGSASKIFRDFYWFWLQKSFQNQPKINQKSIKINKK